MEIVEFIEHLEKLNFSLAVENGKLNLKGDKKKLGQKQLDDITKNQFVINYIKENKNEIIQFLSIFQDSQSEMDPSNISSIYRLSGLQAGILFHGLYDGRVGVYTQQFIYDLENPDMNAFLKSWEHVMNRHTILRSGFYHDTFNIPVQCVYREVKLPVTNLDYREMNSDDQSAAVAEFVATDKVKGFDFKSVPLMRVGLLRLSEDRYRMVLTYHHILFDGWSMQVLMEEFLSTYDSLVAGKEVKAVEEDRYEDYIRYIERGDKEQQETYWRNCMKGLENGTLLPFTRATTQRTKGVGAYKTEHLQMDAETTARIAAYAQTNHITINTITQGVWSYLLHRYTGKTNIVFGVAVSGRPEDLPEVEQRVGMYVNTLPLHSTMEKEQTISEWLKRVQDQQISSRQFQYTPLHEVQGLAGVQGDFFDSIIGFENYPVNKEISSKQWSLQIKKVSVYDQTNYPLAIIIVSAEKIDVHFSYNTGILEEVYVKMIRSHFEHVLLQIISKPNGRLSEIELLTKDDKQQLMLDFNDTKVSYPADKTVLDLFEAQVLKTPEAVAVAYEQQQLTYHVLNERSNQVAHYLKSKGVKAETLVSICMERSIEVIVGMLGILKAGGAYVPIDPEYPLERIKYMLEDTSSEIVLISKAIRPKLQSSDELDIVELDGDWSTISKQSTDNLQITVQPNNLAYVIYTSGSTGLPKGVMIEHSGLVNLITWHNQVYQVSEKSRTTLMSGMGFDAFGWEIWPYLSVGASITIVDDDTRLSASGLLFLFNLYEITHCFMPTVLVPEFINTSRQKLRTLKYLLTGGDRLPGVNIDGESFKLVNNYGPTENTVVTTFYELSSKDNNVIPPIGKPIFNTVVHILDQHKAHVPMGVAGEICIGGAGLARGYLNRPELTSEKFIPNPFDTKPGSRLYRTGDLGVWLPDGNIEYVRRSDDQVKIRGFRIELGEIETSMNKLEEVNSSCVVVKTDNNSASRLVAYFVPNLQTVKAKERELYARLIANWKEIYEDEYAKTELAEDIDHEFNIVGWNDSNGQVIPPAEMAEWVRDIVEVIMSEKPENVLEIGSGTGLIYYQLAGKVKKYTGADFSRSSINQISERISKGLRDYGPTELQVCAAHEVSLKEGENVDTIILNSIVQYFPGEDYMTTVIGNSLSFFKGKGRIIVGDVRDNRLLEMFKGRVQIKKLSESASIREFKWALEQEVLREKELCYSPEYFYGLQSLYPEITHVEIRWKQGTYINELTLYRFTVIIHVGTEAEVIKPDWQSWETFGDTQKIITQLEQGNIVAIKDLPNQRLWQEQLLNKGLQDNSVRNVGDLLKIINKEDVETAKVRNILNDILDKGYICRFLLSEDIFKVNAVFEPKFSNNVFEQPHSKKTNEPVTLNTNIPLFTDISELLQKDIRHSLQQSLPDYMVPAELISLSQLPLTNNGKVDRSFLSQREEKTLGNKLNYVAPRNELEEKLAHIWKELLRVEQVGINDNFFELGGDSIISIQVVSRGRRLGYELKPKDIFIHQTIANLSAAIAERSVAMKTGEQDLLKGRSGLLPIQQWYFERTTDDISYFNQGVLLSIDKQVTQEILKRAVEKLTAHHDVLRFRYQKKDGQWIQEYGTETGVLNTLDLRTCKEDLFADQIKEHSEKYQRSFDIEKGTLARFVLIQTPTYQSHNRVLIIIHHLAVDGVSWRILLDDLELLLSELRMEGKADLGYKSSSYRQWYEALEQYGKSRRLLLQIPYWEEVADSYQQLPVDKNYTGVIEQKNIASHSTRLNAAQTQLLLQEVPRVYHTEINDMLLCALALTLCEKGANEKVIIGLEGHGRESISDVVDTSHTVGWFTSLYPVLLGIEKGSGLSNSIKSVKEQLRRVPDRGLGYGVLKYINNNEKLHGKDCWDIVFNYLGQLDNVVSNGKWLSGAGESKGASSGEGHPVNYLLSLNCMVQGGELIINWGYSSLHYEKGTVSQLAERFQSVLASLVSHCLDQQKSDLIYTPSDYGLASEITYEEMDRFMDEPFRNLPRRASVEGLYRLSGLQQGLLFHSLYAAKEGLYMNQFSCELINPDIENLIRSWNHVLKNHSILRTGFYYNVFSLPVQVVYRDVEIPAKIIDLSDLNAEQQKAAIKEYSETDIANGFDFTAAPLMRIALFLLSEGRYQMLMTYHHILLDGWSVQILMDEFLGGYESLISGKEVRLKDGDRYEDYIRYIERLDKEKEEKFWRDYMKGAEQSTLLPFIGNTPERNKGLGLYKQSVLQLDTETTEKINSYAQAHRVTLNTLIQGVWSYLLFRYTGSRDIIYGVTVSGRPDDLRDVEQRVGMYINTIPSHTIIRENQTITEWLQGMQKDEVLSRQYQYTPLQDIQKWIEIQGDFFDNTLTFQNFPMSKLGITSKLNLKVENLFVKEQNNFPLSLTIVNGKKINVRLTYNSALLKEEYLNEIQRHFENVLQQIIFADEKMQVQDINLLTAEEKQQLLVDFNNTHVIYPAYKSIVHLFEEQAVKTPDNVAVVFDDQQLTYQLLNEKANQLANYLKIKGVRKEQLVPVSIERSLEMPVVLLGILKAGAAYVPVDPTYPEERINYVLEDTAANIIITNLNNEGKLPIGTTLVLIDGDWGLISRQPAANLTMEIAPKQLAYVIYTSGSTGKPKGVMIEHGSMCSYLLNNKTRYITEDACTSGSYVHLSYTFDASLTAMFMPLLAGKSVIISSRQSSLDVFDDTNFWKHAPYDFLKITPSHLELLQPSMRTPNGEAVTKMLVIGGEALLLSQLNFLVEEGLNVNIVNEYGPTEATVGCSIFCFNSLGENETIRKNNNLSIGMPIDNVQLYILNDKSELLPVGVPGELCIGGAGLARGYLNLDLLTREKFIPNPFSKADGARIYKTGDIASWAPDGNITYQGRKDEQVKIRGYRIELGEIESVLQECADVRQSVVIAREDRLGNNWLTAYIVPNGDFDREAILSYLGRKLPDYMVPAVLMEMESLPLTVNGKVDRKLLPDVEAGDMSDNNNNRIAPETETEQMLAILWKQILELDEIGVNEDFFDIGGHSLMAIRLISSIRKAFQVEMQISDIFNFSTIALLAKRLEKQTNTTVLPIIQVMNPRPKHIPLSFSQERLWFIDQLQGTVQYHLPSILRLKGKLNKQALSYALQQIINRHEVLRTVIRDEEGIGYQYIHEQDVWKMNLVDGAQYKEQGEALKRHINQLISKPFDLAKDCMLRADLLHLEEEEHILIVTLHHISSDGWSTSIIVKELVELYKAYEEGRQAVLSILPLQYADYSIWQRNYLQGPILENRLSYWVSKLQGVEQLQLTTDFVRPVVQSTKGAFSRFLIDKPLAEKIQQLAHQQGASLFMTLLAAFKVLLYRYSGQQDICIGTPIANRPQQELESLIGFFINTLAIRSDLTDNPSFSGLLQQVKASTLEAYEHQDMPFEKVVDAVVKERDMSRNPLFQLLFTMNNTPKVPQLNIGEITLSLEEYELTTAQFDIICSITETPKGLQGSLAYCKDLFTEHTIRRMIGHFSELLRSIVNEPQQRISALPMLSQEEENQLLEQFNNSAVNYATGITVVSLFEAQAAKNPNKLAVVFEEEQLSYHELNQRANQLAAYLKRRGVKEEKLVPICIERSIDMLVGILAILKAGGVYVPIDPEYPLERIIYMIKDIGASTVLSSSGSFSKLPNENQLDIVLIDGDWPLISLEAAENLATPIRPEQLAYVIYTSGSTGRPKGVMIEHRNMLSYLLNDKTKYITGEEANAGSFIHLSYTFDASLTAMFMPLLAGKPVVIGSKGSIDVFEDPNLEKYAPYDFIKITPSHLAFLQPKMKINKGGLLTHRVVVGGEALFRGQFSYMGEEGLDVEIINEYGPTEATVGCSVFGFNTNAIEKLKNEISIGKPIDNVQLYILGAYDELVPLGVAGELCIGGAGVARGYLNRPDLTAEKFVQDPFNKAEGARMYRTGDIGRWLPDGNVEYIGRKDEQVKIRGYRVELGEIEGVLQECELVSQAAVLVKENKEGTKRLVAYIVPVNSFDKESIHEYMKKILPEYMLPVQWVELKTLPLTSNGKVDRRALPDSEGSELLTNQFVAPRNDFEKVLTLIWQELLNVETVGIQDNFFELGGDSIIIIQVVGRARRAGYEFKVPDVFTHQTIARLSELMERNVNTLSDVSSEEGMLTGLAGLLPIQQWYFEKNPAEISHFNQAVLLSVDKLVTPAVLKEAIEQLMLQHDALRFRYTKMDGAWQQEYGSSAGTIITEQLQPAAGESLGVLIRQKADHHQRQLDIEKGELVRVVLLQTPANESHNRLLMVIHHLAIDGVSWRILLEDLEILLSAISQGQPVALGAKSSSYRQWFNALEQYGQTSGVLSQKEYWQYTVQAYESLPTDKNNATKARPGDITHHSIRLNAEQTKRLLQEVPRVYHTEINDILLCALAATLCEWTNSSKVVIGLEGHGREAIADNIDTSRTAGWFTSLYPVLLETTKDTGNLIKSIKEQLRQVPGRGLGYGVLKYINREATLQSEGTDWDIVFNYLGQFDNVVSESKWLKGAGESTGASISELYEQSEKMSVSGFVQGGELGLNWSYSGLHYEADTIRQLAGRYLSKLESIIAHCIEQEQQSGQVFTPSDYGLGAEITYAELDAFLEEPINGKKRREQVAGIYRLSGLQQGMLFHGLYDDRAGAYMEQFNCDLINPNIGWLSKSWQHVFNNHSILRSAFYYDVFSVPVQCVYRDVSLPLNVVDYSGLGEAEQAKAISHYEMADQQKGFDFTSAPLMRISLIKLNADRYRMLWTSHHILFDGWSLPILMEEFLSTYESFANDTAVKQQEEDKFEDYIRYIESRDEEAEKDFWQNYLKGLCQATLLPFIGTTAERTKGAGTYQSLPLHLDMAMTEKIQHYSQKHHLTINTVMQGVWSLLLHRFTGNGNVVFGTIVSGRPGELSNIEKRVGMYINTLPLHSVFHGDQTITSWLQLLQVQQVASRQYQYTPLQNIQGWAGITGDLFDSLLVFENYPVSEMIGSKQWSLGVENVRMHEQTNYPLTMIVSSAKEININFHYNSSVLAEFFVNAIKNHFEHALLQMMANAERTLREIELLPETEKHVLLTELNDTARGYAKDKPIIDLFEEQVEKTPGATAVIFEEEELSYGELNKRSNQLAHYLKASGIKAESLVPILLDRGIEMIVGILGILKAGGAYVPIDPEYPAERISYMLDDTAAALIITNETNRAKLHEVGVEIIALDNDWPKISNQPSGNLQELILPDQLAYVIYTSGSTGQPKGAMNEHLGVANRLNWAQEYYRLTPEDSILQKTTFCFDVSVWELLWPLIAGAKLVFAKPGGHKDNDYLRSIINSRDITLMHFVPSMLEVFLSDINQGDCKGLRKVLCSGEALKPSHVALFHEKLPHVELHNLYGPTEAAIDVTYWSVPGNIAGEQMLSIIPIGKPVANTSMYILDENNHLVPMGAIGQLHIGGVQVGRGYLNRPELTAEKFITDPFSNVQNARMYKTGDLGRWLADGNIEYLGRIDDQVKIRGYRIELGEIESILQKSGLVRQSVVLAKETKDGTKRLVGYVLPVNNFTREAVTEYLSNHLPEYMVPRLWVALESLPLTSNGKINKKALPDVDANDLSASEFVASRNELERHLSDIWQRLLEVQRISIHDNFFELGGNSLLAMRLVSVVRKALQVEIAIKSVFNNTTIATLAAHIANHDKNLLLPPIEAMQRPERIPLSFGQERLWFIDRLEGTAQYHLPAVLRLAGELNQDALEFAISTIINRHEVLRTVFLEQDGEAYQFIKEQAEWELSVTDGSVYINDAPGLQQLIRLFISKPFDLSKDNMLRANLVSLTEVEHVLVITFHHIASDAWSTAILVAEVVELYNACEQKRTPVLANLPIQYADFAIWQRNYLQGEVIDKKLDYWIKKLGDTEPLQMPTDFARPAIQTSRGATAAFSFDKELTTALNQLSQQHGGTLFMVLLTALKVLLYRYSNQSDICIGTGIAGRQQHELEGLIGFFVNTLALRTQVNTGESFVDLLQQVKTTTLEAYEHQDVPFEKVVDAVVKKRDRSRNPLFQVMFVLHNTPDVPALQLGKLQLVKQEHQQSTAQFDLSFSITEHNNGMKGSLEYNTDLYQPETIQRLLMHFQQLIVSIINAPQKKISELSIMTRAEEQQIIHAFNSAELCYPEDKNIIALFEEQAALIPGATAVIFGNEKLTYQQLNERSNQLAHYLQSRGVKAETLVAICIERSLEMVISMLGILKAGGAYVPIDTEFPAERIQFMLEDAAANIVITSKNASTKLPVNDILEIVCLNEEGSELITHSTANLLNTIHPESLAYIIYTSGSTGKPKGVMIEHHNVSALIHWCHKEYASSHFEIVYASTSICFDISVFEIFYTLSTGKSLRIVENGLHIASHLTDDTSVLINTVPSVIENLLMEKTDLTNVSVINMAGEPVPWKVQQSLDTENIEVRNLYGPTEDTVYTTVYRLRQGMPILIGKPINNTRIFIKTADDHLSPVGVAGEICIGGAGLGRGYLNRLDLTKEKFVENPFSDVPGERMYKTGDIGRWLPDGNIEYLGRIDEQVKIRGYRIELGEIETILKKADFLHQAVVRVWEDTDGNKYLVGYIVPGELYNKHVLTLYLEAKLPAYMIPTLWVELEQLPVTSNGKIDRKALPDPVVSGLFGDAYVAPVTEIEIKLVAAWQDILRIDRIGINDNFFELGGHSLLAMRLISAIRKQLQADLSVKELFMYPTVASLSAYLAQQEKGSMLPAIEPYPRPKHIPLSFSQERLWFVDQLDGSVQYNHPTVLRLKGKVNSGAIGYALQHIITRHEVLRTVFYETGGTPYQSVVDKSGWKMNYVDGSAYNEDPAALKAFIERQISEPFDLSNDYMLRADFITLKAEEYVLVVTMHHIASDAWSLPIIVQEVVELYSAFVEERPPLLSSLPVQYIDYAIWQRKYLEGRIMDNKTAYWKRKLDGVTALQLPTDHVRPTVRSIRGASLDVMIGKELSGQLNLFSKEQGTTLFMTLLATFNVMLYRYSSDQDICVGTSIANRPQQELEGMIGFFVNTLALRNSVVETASFTELLQQVKNTTLEAYEHQDVPFEKVVEEVVKERDPARSPLFQVMLVLLNTPESARLGFNEIELSNEGFENKISKFEITFHVTETANGLHISIVYNTDLFREDTIMRMAGHFQQLLSSVVKEPHQPIDSLQMLTEAEEQQLLLEFN